MKYQRNAIWTWAVAALVSGFVTIFGLTFLAIHFYVSFNMLSEMGSLGVAALLTIAGTWAWRNRVDRRSSLSSAALMAGIQATAFALGYLGAVESFNFFYPPNFT